VLRGILETRKQIIRSRCEHFCSSDEELTTLDADKPRRMKGFKTGWNYGEELVYKLYLFRYGSPSSASF